MDCKSAQILIDGCLDHELEPGRSFEIEEHLRQCAFCSQTYKEHQVLSGAMREGAPYFQAPADLEKRIRRSLRQTAKADPSTQRLSWSWLKLAAPLVAAMLALVILVPFLHNPSTEETLAQGVVSSHVRSLMVDHLADVQSTDQHTVKPWFNGKLDFSPPVEDLSNDGFPLVGGRLDYLNNRAVAALVYQRAQHLINVFVWPSSEGSTSGMKAETRQGYHVYHWTLSGLTIWVVSDLEERQLREFVQLLDKSISRQLKLEPN